MGPSLPSLPSPSSPLAAQATPLTGTTTPPRPGLGWLKPIFEHAAGRPLAPREEQTVLETTREATGQRKPLGRWYDSPDVLKEGHGLLQVFGEEATDLAETIGETTMPEWVKNVGKTATGIATAIPMAALGTVSMARKATGASPRTEYASPEEYLAKRNAAVTEVSKFMGGALAKTGKEVGGAIVEDIAEFVTDPLEYAEKKPLDALLWLTMAGKGVQAVGRQLSIRAWSPAAREALLEKIGPVLPRTMTAEARATLPAKLAGEFRPGLAAAGVGTEAVGKAAAGVIDVPTWVSALLAKAGKAKGTPTLLKQWISNLVPEGDLASPALQSAMTKAEVAFPKKAAEKLAEYEARVAPLTTAEKETIERALHGVEPGVEAQIKLRSWEGFSALPSRPLKTETAMGVAQDALRSLVEKRSDYAAKLAMRTQNAERELERMASKAQMVGARLDKAKRQRELWSSQGDATKLKAWLASAERDLETLDRATFVRATLAREHGPEWFLEHATDPAVTTGWMHWRRQSEILWEEIKMAGSRLEELGQKTSPRSIHRIQLRNEIAERARLKAERTLQALQERQRSGWVPLRLGGIEELEQRLIETQGWQSLFGTKRSELLDRVIGGAFDIQYVAAHPGMDTLLNATLAPWRKEVLRDSALFAKYGYVPLARFWSEAGQYGHLFFPRAEEAAFRGTAKQAFQSKLVSEPGTIFMRSKIRVLMDKIGREGALAEATEKGMIRDLKHQYVYTPALIEHELSRLKSFEELAKPSTSTAAGSYARPGPTEGYVRLPISKRLGALAGKFVPEQDAFVLTRYEQSAAAWTAADKAMQAWKLIHTAFNPSTWAANLAGNSTVLATAAGVSPFSPPNAPFYRQAIEEMARGKGIGIEGLLATGKLRVSPLEMEILKGEGQVLRGWKVGTKDALNSLFDMVRKVFTPRELPEAIRNLGVEVTKFYGAQDVPYRLAAFLKYETWRKEFVATKRLPREAVAQWGEDEAARVFANGAFGTATKAAEAFVDTSKVSPVVETLSRKWWGIPFLRFTAKAIPRFTEWLSQHPGQAYGQLLLDDFFERLSGNVSGLSEDDHAAWKELMAEAYPYRIADVPVGGRTSGVDVGRYSVFGGKLPELGTAPGVKHLMIGLTGYDPFLQRQVVPASAPAGKKLTTAIGGALGEFVPLKYLIQNVWAAAHGKPMPYSQEIRSVGQTLAANLLALKIQKIDPKEVARRIGGKTYFAVDELLDFARKADRAQEYDERDFWLELAKKARAKRGALETKFQRLFGPTP